MRLPLAAVLPLALACAMFSACELEWPSGSALPVSPMTGDTGWSAKPFSHIAERHAGLFQRTRKPGRAITWMFAALSTVEPPILKLVTARILEGDKPWSKERLPLVQDRIRVRLGELSARLGNADWLDGAFSAGDLLWWPCCSG